MSTEQSKTPEVKPLGRYRDYEGGLSSHPDGEYVHIEDYRALEQQRDSLQEQLRKGADYARQLNEDKDNFESEKQLLTAQMAVMSAEWDKAKVFISPALHGQSVQLLSEFGKVFTNSPAAAKELLERVKRMEGALVKAKHALTWSNPTGGAACAGEVTQQMAEQWFDEANDAIDEALPATQPPAKE